jgi:hypothetical protein
MDEDELDYSRHGDMNLASHGDPGHPPKRPGKRSGALIVDPSIRLEQFELLIRGSSNEVLGIFSSDGRLLFPPKTGAERSVTLTAEEARQVPKGSILSHSHPDDLPLSAQDLVTAKLLQLGEIRAVAPTKTFVVRRPKNGWRVSEGRLREAEERAQLLARRALEQAAKSGRNLSDTEADLIYNEAAGRAMTEALKSLGITMREQKP